MGAKKPQDVAGAATEKLTAAVTAGADVNVSAFRRVTTSGGSTYKGGIVRVGTPQTVKAGEQMKLVDAGIYLYVGVAGTTSNGLSDAECIAALDAAVPTGASTEYLEWYTGAAGAETSLRSRLADTAIDAWGPAAAY